MVLTLQGQESMWYAFSWIQAWFPPLEENDEVVPHERSLPVLSTHSGPRYTTFAMASDTRLVKFLSLNKEACRIGEQFFWVLKNVYWHLFHLSSGLIVTSG